MSLRTKVLGSLGALILLGAGLILFLTSRAVNDVLLDGLAQRGMAVLRETAGAASPEVARGDEAALLAMLNAAAARAQADYAMALDQSGTVLAHTNVLERGKTYADALTRQALRADLGTFSVGEDHGRPVLDVAMPVWRADEDFLIAQEKGGQTRIGTLRLGLPLGETAATRARIVRQIILILLLTAGGLMGAAYLLVDRVVGPVADLALLAERIGAGERQLRVPAASRDEIGHLARSFNRMVDDLTQTTVSKEYLDDILRSLADGLVVIGPDGAIKSVNDAMTRLAGYEAAELVGRPLVETLDGGAAGRTLAAGLAKLKAGGSLSDYETQYRTKDGQLVPVLVSGSLLKGDVAVLAKDLRERKRFESMLIQSEKLSAVGQLAAGVAHEINNPLGIILGFAQSAVKRVPTEDPMAVPVRSIEREALRCKTLVQNLLTFSRRHKSQMETFDLDEDVAASLGIIEAQARVKSVEVRQELRAKTRLLADKSQLQQVLVNLCTNALDAMPEGGTLTVRTYAVGEDRERHVALDIQDSGTGIPAAIRDRIFDPFFTTKEVGKGTGLGLSLVYDIVQRHGGAISVASEEGRGTTFTVKLPVRS